MTTKQENIAANLAEANSPAHRAKIWQRLVNERLDAAAELEAIAEQHRAVGHVTEYERCVLSAQTLRRPFYGRSH